MRFIILAIMVMMVSIAGGETIQVGNYTVDFNIDQTHIYEDHTIKTFNGNIGLVEGVNTWEENSKELIEHRKVIAIGERNGYFLWVSPDPSYLAIPIDTSNGPGIFTLSTMNLSDTIDFIDTLNVSESS